MINAQQAKEWTKSFTKEDKNYILKYIENAIKKEASLGNTNLEFNIREYTNKPTLVNAVDRELQVNGFQVTIINETKNLHNGYLAIKWG